MIRVAPRAPRWYDVLGTFSTVPRALRLVWEAHRPATIGVAIVTLLMSMLPVSQAWVAKLIVDTVVQAITERQMVQVGMQTAVPFLLLEFGLITLGLILGELRKLLEHVLSSYMRYNMNTALIRKALGLDLHYFEDAEFYNKLQNAREETSFRALSLLDISFRLMQNCITLISFVVLLFALGPLIALILFGATLPSFLAQLRYGYSRFSMLTQRASQLRRMYYLEHILTVDTSAKEIKLFGLGEPLLNRYHDLFWQFYREDTQLVRNRSVASLLWGLASSVSYYIAYAWIIWRTISGSLTVGDMALYLTVFRQSQSTIQEMFNNLGIIYENSLFINNLFAFLGLRPQIKDPDQARPMPRLIREGIEFRGVSFRYPGREEWALRDVNLCIAPGEKIALVGANGAGKTTMVKLLARLYEPTEGQILIDGVDLRDYNLDDLRARIGVIFQDFVHYQATVRENIGFGQVAALDDEPRIIAAAQRGGADEVIEALPSGYDTMLGHWFEEGQELSGGQWQKIALGRAFMRDGEVLVLDEPTAALDAEHEYEIFQRFRTLTDGKIALLISHRFSTVRMADRIAVLEHGHLIESGTHEELLAQDGTYARLFNMQAAGYR